MDKELVRERFARATSTYLKQASVQQDVADRMVSLLQRHTSEDIHRYVWETGCGTGLFTYRYLEHFRPQRMWLNDICPEVETCFSSIAGEDICFVPGDAEHLRPSSPITLVASCSALQWFNDPIGYLCHCREWLTAEGCVAVSTFGPDNMQELSAVEGAGLPYISLPLLVKGVEYAGYTVLHASEERLSLSFLSPVEVLRHLKQTGVTGVERRQWTRGKLERFSRDYHHRFSQADGTVPLTYHPIYMILKK